MSKFTTTLKGLMALALGSFALSASALPTISPAPTDGAFAENTTWYVWNAPLAGHKGYIVNRPSFRNESDTQFKLTDEIVNPANSEMRAYLGDEGLWCITGSETDGYTFYNKAAGVSKVLGVAKTGGASAASGLYDFDNVPEEINTKFIIEDANSSGNYTLKLKDAANSAVLNDRDGNLAIYETSDYAGDEGSAFQFRAFADFAATLSSEYLTTDESNPKFILIKNARLNQYVRASGTTQLAVVGDLGGNAISYNYADALWYFVPVGGPREIKCGDGSVRLFTPVYIKNYTQPGRAFDTFASEPFTANGRVYYLTALTQDGYTGYAIMKQNADTGFRPANQDDAWHGYVSEYIGKYKVGDAGSVFSFEKASENKIEGTKQNYIAQTKIDFKAASELLARILDTFAGGTTTTEFEARVDAAQTLEDLMLLKDENIYSKLDRKVLYLVANGRSDEQGKYIYLDKNDNRFRATTHKCVLGKWQLVQRSGGNNFYLRNIATDTYISAQSGNQASSATSAPTNQLPLEFVLHKDGNGFVLKQVGYPTVMKIGTAVNDHLQYQTNIADPSNLSDLAYSFSFEPANIAESAIEDNNTLCVIRSKRGKVEEDSYAFNENVKYPGSLVTAYHADRELARERVEYRNGAHLEVYGPGSVWKFVKVGEGWKIYSLIGEQTDATQNKGLKVVNGYVDVVADPDVFYLKEVTDANDPYAMPNVYALCTAQEGGQYVTVSDVNDHGDYFLTLGNTAPTTAADDAASFYIEGIGKIHTESEPKGANPEKEYIDYARELHMFKSISPVLDDEDMEYILAEKEGYNYANIGSIAEANDFMAKGDMTASSRAFQRLDGKMIRLQNRMYNTYYLFSNTGAPDWNNPLAGTASLNDDFTLTSIWVVELPESAARTTDDAARMRQFRLRNLATGNYVMSNLQTGTVENAQTLTVRRRASLDGNDFFLALTKDYERNTALYFNGTSGALLTTSWGSNSAEVAHWTVVNAVSEDVPTVTLAKSTTIDDTYELTIEGATGVNDIEWIGKATIEEVTPQRVLNAGQNEIELTAADGKISGNIGENLSSDLGDRKFIVKLPAGLLTMGTNVSPAVEQSFTVKSDGSVTGIREVNAAEKGAEVIYDLQGRRVSKASKGVYIINGVKTLVR